jgi:AmiR/NasT family two-component response regulator
MTYRVLIVGGSKTSDEAAGLLKEAGCKEIYIARDGRTAIGMARSHLPDVILMDAGLQGEDSVSVCKDILVERPVPIVMHASYGQSEKVKEGIDMGVSAHLFRPITRDNLLATIELGLSRFRQCQALHVELGDCKEALRVRKLVERAKGILMKRNSLTEEEAFLKLQRLSRNNNIPMEKVAESIIMASEII